MFEGFDPIKQQEHEKYLEYFSTQVQSRLTQRFIPDKVIK